MHFKQILSLFVFSAGCATALAQVEKAHDFTAEHLFTINCEGPAVSKEGILYAVNYKKDGTVAVLKPDGSVSTFVTLPDGSIGNGIVFNKKGQMLIADFSGHNVIRVDMKTKLVDTLVHDDAFNQPNDVTIAPNDDVYASDPNFKLGTGQIWLIKQDGSHRKVDSGMHETNGIEVSPDGKKLYVNESDTRIIWMYTIQPDGSLADKKMFYQFHDENMDGMRCDAKGNLYLARWGTGMVFEFSQGGKLLKTIALRGKNAAILLLAASGEPPLL